MRIMPTFPLLTKELTEQAARKRTYVLRSGYALLLLLAFAVMYNQTAQHYGDQLSGMIGIGGQLFDAIFYCQYWAILLLMPALAAGALTSEKEQGSLTILLLTDLGPWELLLQKWLSRLVLVGSFLLLSLPLMGLCYAYGGLDMERLGVGISLLLLTCLQTAAVAIAVSAWCRSSITALLGTYAVLGVMYLGPGLLFDSDFLWPLRLFMPLGYGRPLTHIGMLVIPILVSVMLALLFARWALPRRAQLSGSGPLLRLLRWLDALFERGDAAIGRRRGPADLPDLRPVAWRELNRRSLANWRYLVRFLVIGLGAIIILFSTFALHSRWDTFNTLLQVSALSLLGLTLLLALVLGSTVISTERTQQTMDVLLTTPLTARTILIEKLHGLRRITWAIVLPGLVLACWQHYDHQLASGGYFYGYRGQTNIYATVAYFLILPPLFTWFAVAIGLLVHNRNRAVVVALIGGCVWMGSVIPVALVLFDLIGLNEASEAFILCFLTPGMLPLFTVNGQGFSSDHVARGGLPLMISVYVIWHIFLCLMLRWWCLRHADRLMRRSVGS